MKIDKAPFCLGFYLFFSVICGIIRYNEKYARSKNITKEERSGEVMFKHKKKIIGSLQAATALALYIITVGGCKGKSRE